MTTVSAVAEASKGVPSSLFIGGAVGSPNLDLPSAELAINVNKVSARSRTADKRDNSESGSYREYNEQFKTVPVGDLNTTGNAW